MDAATSRNATTGASRNLFFGAEDRRISAPRPVGDEDKALSIVKTRRSQMAENVIATANNLANAVRTLRSYDRTGNTGQAVGHIEATFEDLRRQTLALVDEVQAACIRDSGHAAAPSSVRIGGMDLPLPPVPAAAGGAVETHMVPLTREELAEILDYPAGSPLSSPLGPVRPATPRTIAEASR